MAPADPVDSSAESDPGVVRGAAEFDLCCDPARPFDPAGDVPDELDAVDPADPAVSANATTGSEATVAPTPSAIANAPILPTYREGPNFDGDRVGRGPPKSMLRGKTPGETRLRRTPPASSSWITVLFEAS